MACSVSGCDIHDHARGLCSKHYSRWVRHSDPLVCRTPRGTPLLYVQEAVITFSEDRCLTWPFSKSPTGYGQIRINGGQRNVARYVCEIAHGSPPSSSHQAAHSCGRGHEGCCNPLHLSWKTGVENNADKLLHGTHNRGERHNMVKLSEADVRQIRGMTGQMSLAKIGQLFGVHKAQVDRIQKRKGWAHVD